MGVYAKRAGAWQQIGVDSQAVRWATVTGGTVTTVTNSDGSVDEVHTFTANGTLTVTKAGYAEVLLVGGGSFGASGTEGAGGRIVSGLRSLPSGALAVVVGVGGAPGQPSLLGALTTYSSPYYWGGAGSSASGGTTGSQTGFPSSITGTALDYARGGQASPRVNFGDGKVDGSAAGSIGVVIVRIRITDALPLPAATGWAQVTGGTVTEYTKPDGSVMEVHTFTAAGSLTVVAAGYADVLVVGGGQGGYGPDARPGAGGGCWQGTQLLPSGALAVTVGAASAWGSPAGQSSLGTLRKAGGARTDAGPASGVSGGFTAGGVQGSLSTGGGGSEAANAAAVGGAGLVSSITGSPVEYGRGGNTTGTVPAANTGGGAGQSLAGAAGIVIVAVQKTPPTASGVVASGGTETTFVGDGVNGLLGVTYKVHKFTASGTLTVTQGGSVDFLLVGAGGGGIYGTGGGGGGGGCVVEKFTEPVAAGVLPVTVGAGATGAAGGGSSFNGNTAAGGGPGNAGVGGPGGNGGGAGGGVSLAGGVSVAGGYAGGASSATQYVGGGGGGAGGAGAAGAGNNAGNGGAGKSSVMNGTSTYYGGGGGGGSNPGTRGTGQHGGGDGGQGGSANQTSGTANTGGGGGGTNQPPATSGGSGVVIVRYKVAA